MAPQSGFNRHLSAEMLEEYAFKRLSEAAVESLEEHLLLCTACQSKLREVDEYILLMKHAAARRGTDPSPTSTGVGRVRWGAFMGGVMALAIIGIAILLGVQRVEPGAALEQVELTAFRGDDGMAHAFAGRPIHVVMDAADLPGSNRYQVEVVNASGRSIWKAPAIAAEGRLSALISTRLKRGIYWVRLSTSQGELVREYGLRAE